MDTFIKAIAGILIGLVLWICLQRQEKDMALLLTLAVCSMVTVLALKMLSPILDFLHKLVRLGQIQEDYLGILLKAAGIALTAELAGMICSDTGNSAMEKTVHFLGSVSIMAISVPIFEALLKLIQELLDTV